MAATVTDTLRETYLQQGFVILDEVIPRDEALALGDELQEIIAGRNTNILWDGDWASEEQRQKERIYDIHGAQEYSKAFGDLMRRREFIEPLANLLGGSAMLHHNKGFVKPRAVGDTHGGSFPPHQDYPQLPHVDERCLAAILYLTDIVEEMGAVRIYPRSHVEGPLPTLEDGRSLDIADWPLENSIPVVGRAGTIAAFCINTVHMSGPNLSDRDRISWLIQLSHPENPPADDRHPGLNQGEILWPPKES